MLIVCVSPSSLHTNETQLSLGFARRVKGIRRARSCASVAQSDASVLKLKEKHAHEIHRISQDIERLGKAQRTASVEISSKASEVKKKDEEVI